MAERATRLQAIAVDLDGTLLRSDGSISERTRSALAQVSGAGILVVVITARPPRRVRAIADASGLHPLFICSNGALVYEPASGSALMETRLAAEPAMRLVSALRAAAPGVRFAVEAGLRFGREPEYASGDPLDRVDPAMRLAEAAALCDEGVTKLIVQHAALPLDRLLALVREQAGDTAVATHSGASFVEVSAPGVTKGLSLAAFCAARGVERGRVLAFGDMPNDLPMLSWAGHAVAVANAHPEVLAAVAEVSASNDDDGVAAVLERWAARDFACAGR